MSQQVYTLLVTVGRKQGDGLPEGATGAGLLCYSAGKDEAEAVRHAVEVLKTADMNVLEVTGYGTLDDRVEGGFEVGADEREMEAKALADNAVIVVAMEPLFERDEERAKAFRDEAAARKG